jgi:hypothetical protein
MKTLAIAIEDVMHKKIYNLKSMPKKNKTMQRNKYHSK